jgi:hypothetical protein|tara:strand:+ start:552 stop:908 length:357 start_codon:yes stop_codon:yes gene_type:complete
MTDFFVTDEQCESALNYIRDQAPEYGRLRGLIGALEHEIKIAKGQAQLAFLDVDEACKRPTVGESIAHADSCQDVRNLVKELGGVKTDFHTLATHIKAAELKIEVWRSLNSRANKGHV